MHVTTLAALAGEMAGICDTYSLSYLYALLNLA